MTHHQTNRILESITCAERIVRWMVKHTDTGLVPDISVMQRSLKMGDEDFRRGMEWLQDSNLIVLTDSKKKSL